MSISENSSESLDSFRVSPAGDTDPAEARQRLQCQNFGVTSTAGLIVTVFLMFSIRVSSAGGSAVSILTVTLSARRIRQLTTRSTSLSRLRKSFQLTLVWGLP